MTEYHRTAEAPRVLHDVPIRDVDSISNVSHASDRSSSSSVTKANPKYMQPSLFVEEKLLPLPGPMSEWTHAHVLNWLARDNAPWVAPAQHHRMTGTDLVNMDLPTAARLLDGDERVRTREATNLLHEIHAWHEQVRAECMSCDFCVCVCVCV
jgi:hypothetical protein